MNKIYRFALIFIFISSLIGGQEKQIKPLKIPEDFAVITSETTAVLSLAKNISIFKEALGEPKSEPVTIREAKLIQHFWQGISVLASKNGFVWAITIKNNRFATARGLKAGQRLSEAKRLYGEAIELMPGVYSYHAKKDAETWELRITLGEEERISKILLWFGD